MAAFLCVKVFIIHFKIHFLFASLGLFLYRGVWATKEGDVNSWENTDKTLSDINFSSVENTAAATLETFSCWKWNFVLSDFGSVCFLITSDRDKLARVFFLHDKANAKNGIVPNVIKFNVPETQCGASHKAEQVPLQTCIIAIFSAVISTCKSANWRNFLFLILFRFKLF